MSPPPIAHQSSQRLIAWSTTAGISLGWLTGLSASPVIASVLGVVLGSLMGIVAALRWERLSPDVATAFALVLGMGVGAPGGIYVRSHNWLGAAHIESTRAATSQDALTTAQSGVLFSGSRRDSVCGNLAGTGVSGVRALLGQPKYDELKRAIADDTTLFRVMGGLCDVRH